LLIDQSEFVIGDPPTTLLERAVWDSFVGATR